MIVIDMDMPECCSKCPCYDDEYNVCKITKIEPYGDIIYLSRLSDCPLQEYPKRSRVKIGCDSLGRVVFKCLNCKSIIKTSVPIAQREVIKTMNFCPECGAKFKEIEQ